MTANYITVSDVFWHGRTPASYNTTNMKMPWSKSQLLSAVGKQTHALSLSKAAMENAW